jgi:hypothetical protein
MQKLVYFFVFLIGGLGFMLSVAPTPVVANTSQASVEQAIGNCQPLDIIFLIDQSDSMENTDPQNRRISAVNNIIRLLLEHAALRCVGVQHRIGIINFGSSIRPVQFNDDELLQTIQFSNDTNRLKERIDESYINITRFTSASERLGQTRPWLAIEAGIALLNDAPAIDDGVNNPRRKVLMMLSDGNPCNPTDSTPQSSGCGDPTWISHYFEPTDVSRTYFPGNNPAIHGFDTPSGLANAMRVGMPFNVRFDVLLFSGESIRPQTITGWNALTAQYGGSLVQPSAIANTSLITARLSSLVNDLLFIDAQRVVCNSTFTVQPYTASTLILSNVGESRGQITIYDANDTLVQRIDGVNFSQSRLNYIDLGSVERFLIINPEPGTWRVEGPESACANTELTFETIQPVALWETEPTAVEIERVEPYYVVADDHYLEFQLLDSFYQPFRAIFDYPLVITVGIAGPNGSQSQLADVELRFEEQSGNNRPGIWRSSTPLPAPMRGNYVLQITGSAPQIDAPNVELFRLNTSYNTKEPKAVTMQVVNPAPNAILPLNELIQGRAVNLPFEVSVRFIDENNVPILATRLFDRPTADEPIEATLTFPGASNPPEVISLNPSPEDATLLVGRFRANARDAETVDDEGNYQVSFRLNPDVLTMYNNENYTIDVVTTVQTIPFERRRLVGVNLVPLLPIQDNFLALNRIDNDTQSSEPIPLEMRVHLVDQDNVAINPRDLFTSADNAIYVQLYRGAELVSERTPMTLENNEYVIRLREGETDPVGEYRAIFAIGDGVVISPDDYNQERYAFIDGRLKTEVVFNRYELKGVILRDVTFDTTPIENGLPLNTVNPRQPLPLLVSARLEDLSNTPYTTIDTLFPEGTNFDDLVLVELRGTDNTVLEDAIPMTWNPETGLFTASLRENLSVVDAAGEYRLTFRLKTTTLTTEYQLVTAETEPTRFNRTEQVGLNIEWVSPITGAVLPLNTLANNTVNTLPFDVQIRVVDEVNNPVNLQDAISTTDENGVIANVRLISPNGDTYLIPLTIAEGNPTLLVGSRAVPETVQQMDIPGNYTAYVDILPTSVGRTQAIRNYTWLTSAPEPITVERREFYGLQIQMSNPPSLALNNVNQSTSQPQPIQVSARIVAQEGRTLPAEGVFANTDNVMTVSLKDSQGGVIIDSVPMTYQINSGEFVGQLDQPADNPFAAGNYNLVFDIAPSAIKQQDNLSLIATSHTQSVALSNVVGMVLCIITPTINEVTALNVVGNDASTPASVLVQVGMCGLDGKIIALDSIFESLDETSPVISVQLIDLQTNIPIETGVNLTINADNSVFEGQIRPVHNDQQGRYTLTADLLAGYTLKTVDFRQYTVVNASDTVEFVRETKFGIRLVEESPSERYDLNTIVDNQQQPQTVPIVVHLESVADNSIFRDPSVFLANPSEQNNTLMAIMTAQDGTEFREFMQFNNGVYRANLGSTDILDPVGSYSIRFEWNLEALDSSKPYQFVVEPPSRTFERQEIIGVKLVVLNSNADNSISVPIYSSWFDALAGSANPIELRFELQDTKGNRIQPSTIFTGLEDVRLGILAQISGFTDSIDREGTPLDLILNTDGTFTAIIPNSASPDYTAQLRMGIIAPLPDQYRNLNQNISLSPMTRGAMFNPWLVRIITLVIFLMILGYIVNVIRINFFAKTMFGVMSFRLADGTGQGQAPTFDVSLKPAFLRFGFRAVAKKQTYINIKDIKGTPKRSKVSVKIMPLKDKGAPNIHAFNIVMIQDGSVSDKDVKFNRGIANEEVRVAKNDWKARLSAK